MRYGRYGLPYLILRVGLGLTFVWISIDMFRHPDTWIGFLPGTIPLDLSRETALQLIAIFDAALGVLLITGHFARIVSFLAAIHLLGILVVQGVDAVTIRDVGLLGVAVALFLWPYHRRRPWWQKLFNRGSSKSSGDDE